MNNINTSQMSLARLTLQNLELRRNEAKPLDSNSIDTDFTVEVMESPEVGILEDRIDCSALNLRSEDQVNHAQSVRQSARQYWRDAGKNGNQSTEQERFDTCAYLAKPGQQSRKPKESVGKGAELECLTSRQRVVSGQKEIQNYINRNGDDRYQTRKVSDLSNMAKNESVDTFSESAAVFRVFTEQLKNS